MVTVPSSRWAGCSSQGNTFDSSILSPPPCLQAVSPSLALSGVVEGKGVCAVPPLAGGLVEELDLCVSSCLATGQTAGKAVTLEAPLSS